MLDEVENLTFPADFTALLQDFPEARLYFDQLSISRKKMFHLHILFAKRPETQTKRMLEFTNESQF